MRVAVKLLDCFLPGYIKRCQGWGGGRVLVLLDGEGQSVGCSARIQILLCAKTNKQTNKQQQYQQQPGSNDHFSLRQKSEASAEVRG